MANCQFDIIAIVGPTASGKTLLAANLAARVNGEIISADSRQVYRGMNLGTGKDYEDYVVNGKTIPYHLVEMVDAGYRYNVYEYQSDFLKVFLSLKARRVLPILCGGSGLYIEAVLRGYRLLPVPQNTNLRKELEEKSNDELVKILASYKKLHNTTDFDTRKRTIRAIEIEEYYQNAPTEIEPFPQLKSAIFGVRYNRATEMERIRQRLLQRLGNGMVEEVKGLLEAGLSFDDMVYYGLEYRYVAEHIMGKLTYDEMVSRLNIAIRQFAKRQMTWFRGMERRGLSITWIDGELPLEDKLDKIMETIQYNS
jgi:tRNA dimethylallyltransferase